MERIARSWKMLVAMVFAGAVLVYTSLSLQAANRPAAAPAADITGTTAAPSGPPISNEIRDFPQLD